MKKFFLLILPLIAITFSSCGDDYHYHTASYKAKLKATVLGTTVETTDDVQYVITKYTENGLIKMDVTVPEYTLNVPAGAGGATIAIVVGGYTVKGMVPNRTYSWSKDYKDDGLEFNFTMGGTTTERTFTSGTLTVRYAQDGTDEVEVTNVFQPSGFTMGSITTTFCTDDSKQYK